MAGGLGTRLRPLTHLRPKPMVPVVNRPILEHTLELLRQHDITEILMLLYYMPDTIKDYFGNGSEFGVNIEYITAKEDFATAGAVRLAASKLRNSFLVISGDIITDLDLSAFLDFHRAQKAVGSMALSRVADPAAFGIVDLDSSNRIMRFVEKPGQDEIFTNLVNTGVYVFEPDIFELIAENQKVYFERSVFPAMAEHEQPLFGFEHDGYWIDVGVVETYLQVHRDYFAGKIALNPLNASETETQIGTQCRFEGNVVLGPNSIIHDRVRICDSVIGTQCEIGENTDLKNSIVWPGESVTPNSTLRDEVLASLSP